MTTPLVSALRIKYPKVQIDYWTGASSAVVLEGNRDISRVVKLDDKSIHGKQLNGYFKLISGLKKSKYDICLVLDKHWIFTVVALLAGIPKRLGFKRGLLSFNTRNVAYGQIRHEIDYYLDVGALIGVKSKNKQIGLVLGKADLEEGNRMPKPYVAIINSGGNNPGEEGGIRKMPDKLFGNLLGKIAKNNKIVLVGGKSDKQYYAKFNQKNVVNLAGKHSLKQSAGILKYAKLIITTDTGPMHIASAVNDKIISIFGPTNPARKAPLNKGAKSIWKDQKIYEESYELYGKVPKKKFMQKISDDDVLKEFRRLNRSQ